VTQGVGSEFKPSTAKKKNDSNKNIFGRMPA
jgi:hypothetical protein